MSVVMVILLVTSELSHLGYGIAAVGVFLLAVGVANIPASIYLSAIGFGLLLYALIACQLP